MVEPCPVGNAVLSVPQGTSTLQQSHMVDNNKNPYRRGGRPRPPAAPQARSAHTPQLPRLGQAPGPQTTAPQPHHFLASIPLPATGTSGTTFPTELQINHRTHIVPPHHCGSSNPPTPTNKPFFRHTTSLHSSLFTLLSSLRPRAPAPSHPQHTPSFIFPAPKPALRGFFYPITIIFARTPIVKFHKIRIFIPPFCQKRTLHPHPTAYII